METAYFLLHALKSDYGCILDKYPDSMPKIHRPTEGSLLSDEYGLPCNFHMSRRKGGKKAYDLVYNLLGYLITSEQLKEIIALFEPQIEWLPINLVDHKNRRLANTYYIANVLRIIDCVDLVNSEYVEDPMNKPTFQFTKKLVLDSEELDSSLCIFRPLNTPSKILISQSVKAAIEAAGLEGVSFTPTGVPLPNELW